MAQIINTAQLSLIATEDVSSVVPVNRSVEADMNCDFGNYYYTEVGNAAIQQIIFAPPTKAMQLFVRNLSADNANHSIGVFKMFPAAGANPYRLIAVLGPGDFVCIWSRGKNAPTITDPTDGAQGPGLVQIGLLADAVNVPCEYFIGGLN